jgi:small GTP-binding protein
VSDQKVPLIAFIGLPNSGKSTLLNRLTGTRKAIVAKEAHTTRDLNYGEDFWEGMFLRFVDTGGLVPDPATKIEKEVQTKSWSAIARADLLVWVIDRKQDPETIHLSILQRVWKTGKPFVIAINKVDDPNLDRSESDYAFMGGNGFVNMSCNIGYGTNVLMDQIVENLAKLGFSQDQTPQYSNADTIKVRSKKLKDVRPAADGSYYVIRNDEGMFESYTENIEKPELKNIILDLNGVVFKDFGGEINNEVYKFILNQRSLGKKIYYLSNIGPSTLDLLKKNPIFELFDGGVPMDNFDLPLKPDLQIFKHLLKEYNLKAQECIVIDDSIKNVESASELEMQGVLYTPDLNLNLKVEELEGYGGKIPKVIFLGRPNVGKSSLFNAMAGQDIQIITDIAGTTMSVNDSLISLKENREIKLKTNPYLFNKIEGLNDTRFLIFDFDGVICDGLDSDLEADIIRGREKGLDKEEAEKDFWQYFEKPSHTKKHDLSPEEKEKIVKDHQFIATLRFQSRKRTKLFTDFISEIKKIDNTRIAIVSSSSTIFINKLLEKTNLDFDLVLGIEDSVSKEEKIEQVCDFWEIEEKEAYYFTDTKTDVLELEKYLDNTKIIGCSWGYHNFEKLSEVLPQSQILREFNDIQKLFPILHPVKNFKIEEEKQYVLLDSVGIRKPGQRTFGAEDFATYRTIETAHQADVICLVLDGSQAISHQDQVIAGIIKESRKGVVIVVNKADLVSPKQRKNFIHEFETRFDFLKIEKFVWVSAQKILEKGKLEEQTKHLIFDFDGVLGDTWESMIQTNMRIYNRTREQAEEEGLKYFSKTQHAKTDIINKAKMIEEKDRFSDEHIHDAIKYGEIFEGFIEEIKKVENAKLAIVTSNRKDIIEPLLNKIDLKFDYILDYKDSLSKEEKVEKICKNWKIADNDAYYFTDTVSDVVELQDFMNPSKIIGCSWGFLGFEKLREVLPKKQILKDFNDFTRLFGQAEFNEDINDLSRIWKAINEAIEQRKTNINKIELRRLYNYLIKKKPPQKVRNKKRAVVYDLLFTKSSPPTFELLVKDRATIHWSYTRFLENFLRRNFNFGSTEIVIKVREVDKKSVLSY